MLRSSGLSITASSWPFLTTSPATTFRSTVPAEIAYRIGLLAAITRPSAARSRTRSPCLTSAMRTRALSKERLAPSQARAAKTMASTTTSAAMPGHSQRFHGAAVPGVERVWSCAEVSRIIGLVRGWVAVVAEYKAHRVPTFGPLKTMGCEPGVNVRVSADTGTDTFVKRTASKRSSRPR
ncbi:hypothetical protein D9M71_590850 [compost metagenome]